ncbi:unnamed protein product [Didymodactylos carnosus]|uniref:CCHC-type domain-containing protein n=1 Tax=Didymodactylos carnosus TaxID=1234261 RepID=A0A815NJ25_9BILA|nr:unnamed protein product [Didymodactylos carnosus]CAF1434520.1 unnamed protein product [Didymodactylos carnosus]CAF3790753.1 unnamed protein product [Didymodactylos carnosus]CAF4312297.1 unnamed protein product [Didymodactylos carnosus]
MNIKDLRYTTTHGLSSFIVRYDNEESIDRRDLPSAMNAKLYIENHLRRQGVKFNGFALIRSVGKRLKLYVSNRDNYHKLMTTNEWPGICGSIHLKISVVKPSVIPSQFSLVIRNVPASISINKIREDVNCSIRSATNLRKLISKYGKKSIDYRFEVPDLNEYKAAVSQGVIGIGNIVRSITEYIPANRILYCTKCWKIGHWANDCNEAVFKCKICLEDLLDGRHECSTNKKCAQYGGDHISTAPVCNFNQQYQEELNEVVNMQ